MTISLKIDGDGMVINREITLTQAGKIVAFLGSETEGSDAMQPSAPAALSEGKVMQKSRTKKGKSSTAKSKNVTAESVSEAVAGLYPIIPELDGYIGFHDLSTKGLKVLWILAYANANNIDKLSPREISFLASKLRDKIDSRDINGLTVTASKNSWIAKDNDANYSLLHKGDEHLKSLKAENGTS